MFLKDATASYLQWGGMQCYKPMWWASKEYIHSRCTPIRLGEFGNWNNETLEKVSRVFRLGLVALSVPITLPMSWVGMALEALGDNMALRPYIKLESKAPEKISSEPETFWTFNACMLPGGLPILFGGVRPASERMDCMAEFVLEKDADVVLMQEVPFNAGSSLWSKIQHRYKHAFTRIGPAFRLPLDSGLFIASKLPIVKEPTFIKLPSGGVMTRGVFYFETPAHAVFVTHLEPGDDPQDMAMRKTQLDGIIQEIQKTSGKPALLLGDFNIKREGFDKDEYHTSGIPNHFINFYNPKISKETATCTNELTAYAKGKEKTSDLWEHIDYALAYKGSFKKGSLEVSLTPAYDLKKPSQALSDHHGIFVRSFLNS